MGFIKSGFLSGRTFLNDGDLNRQSFEWLKKVNNSPCPAHEKTLEFLLAEEQKKFGRLRESAASYGFLHLAPATSSESLVHFETNGYSVPEEYAGQNVSVRVFPDRLRIFVDQKEIASHQCCFDRKRRIRSPEHFERSFLKKPRARVMVYREQLMGFSPVLSEYISHLCQKNRSGMNSEILRLYELFQKYGQKDLIGAIEIALEEKLLGSSYLEFILRKTGIRFSGPASFIFRRSGSKRHRP